MLYTLHLRLSTPSTKGESSVACMLCHVLHNIGYRVLQTYQFSPANQLGSGKFLLGMRGYWLIQVSIMRGLTVVLFDCF
jgi:hypothetical protein